MKKKSIKDWAEDYSDKQHDIASLQKENAKLRSDINKYRSGEQIIISAIKDLLRVPADTRYPKAPATSRKKATEEIAVLHLSDLHVGKITSSFGTAIAAKRMKVLTDKVIHVAETRRQSAKIEEIRVYLGGDIVEGDGAIFPKQAHLIDSSVLEQATIAAPKILFDCIIRLTEAFKNVTVKCVSGNHGRPGNKHSSDHPNTCWDRVAYKATKMMLLGHANDSPLADRLKFYENDDFYFVDELFGKWGNMVVHGHEIRGGFAGFPWYGTGRKAMGWKSSIKEKWQYLYHGHFHTLASFTVNNGIMCFANGSLETDNEYALQNMAASGTPVQRLTFYSEENGMISDNPIYVVPHQS